MKYVALLALLAGCPTPREGTIELGLTAAPGSTLLDSLQKLRVTLTNPRQTTEAVRGPNGFSLALDVEADGSPGAIVVEGFDSNDLLIAGGQSPDFSIAAIDARIVVYMAAPNSVGAAPVSLSPPRANITGTTLVYGAIFAGGHDAAGAPSDAIAIYNAYDHTLAGGKAMPAPRDGITLASTPSGAVYLFGGRDAASNATGMTWLFDTNTPPSGAYVDLGDHPGLARSGQIAFQVGTDTFIVTGTPAIDLQGTTVQARTDVTGLAATAKSHVINNVVTALALDTTGRLARFHDGAFELLAPSRPGGAVTDLPDGRYIVVGGGTTDEQDDIIVVDSTGGISTLANALATTQSFASVATTRRHIVVVGNSTLEVLDATTLARVTSAPISPTAGAAFALPNEQVLIVDATTGELSLFTPPPGV